MFSFLFSLIDNFVEFLSVNDFIELLVAFVLIVAVSNTRISLNDRQCLNVFFFFMRVIKFFLSIKTSVYYLSKYFKNRFSKYYNYHRRNYHRNTLSQTNRRLSISNRDYSFSTIILNKNNNPVIVRIKEEHDLGERFPVNYSTIRLERKRLIPVRNCFPTRN